LIGQTLFHFKITAKLGEGGMGKVYRAEDTKLGREVAIKVLLEAVAADPERLARFAREAKVLASLNHPNIAAIYQVEEAEVQLSATSDQLLAGDSRDKSPQAREGDREGPGPQAPDKEIRAVHFLVMELAEGEDLRQRLARGAMAVEEALPIAVQIAEALEAAHERGIIHRDLKPANIQVDEQGQVKVLDFGLAKALEFQNFAGSGPQDSSHSPTLTAQMTRAGLLLGTAAYMSPEQARGQDLDPRSDIWSFGCVLYEMMAGKSVFAGPSTTDILAGIVGSEPDWSSLPETLPSRLRRLLERLLAKDPKSRLRDIGDARLELQSLISSPEESPREVESRAASRWLRPLMAALPALVVGGLIGLGVGRLGDPSKTPVTHAEIGILSKQYFRNADHALALSPDGRQLVYCTYRQLFLHSLDQPEAIPIEGTEGAQRPFFSSSGEWLGFWAEGELRKVRLSGGSPITLCPARAPHGASWGADNRVVFGQGSAGIFAVSADGGEPQLLTRPDPEADEVAMHGPQFLPNGELLFTLLRAGQNWNGGQIIVQDLESGERKLLVEPGTDARYLPSGHLVYASGSSLLAISFNADQLEVQGPPTPIQEGVWRAGLWDTGASQFSISETGTLAFIPDSPAFERTLVWVSRDGSEQVLPLTPRFYHHPRLSPDGRRIVVDTIDSLDLWLYDIERETLTRLTAEQTHLHPVWSPDGEHVAFDSTQGLSLYWKAVNREGDSELLTKHDSRLLTPVSFSPDGKILAYESSEDFISYDIGMLSLGGEGRRRLFLDDPEFKETSPMFSPDGRWLAYVSNETGLDEVYVQPYPGPGRKWLISHGGGKEPVWSPTGRELFYRAGRAMMAVPVRIGEDFEAGKPAKLFEGDYGREPISAHPTYDVSHDGQRFLMVKNLAPLESPHRIRLVFNWFDVLRDRMGGGV